MPRMRRTCEELRFSSPSLAARALYTRRGAFFSAAAYNASERARASVLITVCLAYISQECNTTLLLWYTRCIEAAAATAVRRVKLFTAPRARNMKKKKNKSYIAGACERERARGERTNIPPAMFYPGEHRTRARASAA